MAGYSYMLSNGLGGGRCGSKILQLWFMYFTLNTRYWYCLRSEPCGCLCFWSFYEWRELTLWGGNFKHCMITLRSASSADSTSLRPLICPTAHDITQRWYVCTHTSYCQLPLENHRHLETTFIMTRVDSILSCHKKQLMFTHDIVMYF